MEQTCDGMSNLLSSVGVAVGMLGIFGGIALCVVVCTWAFNRWRS